MLPTRESLMASLEEVMDPEFPISVVDLGLIYDIAYEDGRVDVELTYTATGCPCMAFIRDDITERLMREPGVESVAIRERWDPPWTRERMTEKGKAVLRQFGVAS